MPASWPRMGRRTRGQVGQQAPVTVDELPGGNDRDPPPAAIRFGEPLILQRLERGGCPLAGGDVPLGRIRSQPADQVVAQPVGRAA